MSTSNLQESYEFLNKIVNRLFIFTKGLCNIPSLKPALEGLIILAEKEKKDKSGSELEQIETNISIYRGALNIYVNSKHYKGLISKRRRKYFSGSKDSLANVGS